MKRLEVGQIVNTFGIKGQVKVVPFTDDITRFDYLKNVYVKNKKETKQYEVEEVKLNNNEYGMLEATVTKNGKYKLSYVKSKIHRISERVHRKHYWLQGAHSARF